ncbi:benzoquinone reductase [Atractiella rhizophila]|nr:benzoquinone reductase [Atractiella rhizophila]KAH8920834.1 benzoquinone reductase [Atractiella rhizophila]
MPAKILLLYYSTYGHIWKLAESVAKGLKASGATVDIYQIPETLPAEVLTKMHAPPKAQYPPFEDVSLLKGYDGYAFGIPTRYGRAPAQVSAFFDRTGGLWASGALVGKFATIFSSTGSQHGGQETTALSTIPFLAHHGIIYVPIGPHPGLAEMNEVAGGSYYGAATVAAGDGSRQPSDLELRIAEYQGSHFGNTVNTFVAGKSK